MKCTTANVRQIRCQSCASYNPMQNAQSSAYANHIGVGWMDDRCAVSYIMLQNIRNPTHLLLHKLGRHCHQMLHFHFKVLDALVLQTHTLAGSQQVAMYVGGQELSTHKQGNFMGINSLWCQLGRSTTSYTILVSRFPMVLPWDLMDFDTTIMNYLPSWNLKRCVLANTE